jgi:hypothetical protein
MLTVVFLPRLQEAEQCKVPADPTARRPAAADLVPSSPSALGSRHTATSALSPSQACESLPTRDQIDRGVSLFFRHVAPWLDFLHEPTFDPGTAVECVVLACVALGLIYETEPSSAGEMSRQTSLRCYAAAQRLAQQREGDQGDSTSSLAIIQAWLLLEVYAMMYLDDSSKGLSMHSNLVGVRRVLFSDRLPPLTADRPTCLTLTSSLARAVRCSRFRRLICRTSTLCGFSSSRTSRTSGPSSPYTHSQPLARRLTFGRPATSARRSPFTTSTRSTTSCYPSRGSSHISRSSTTFPAGARCGSARPPRIGRTGTSSPTALRPPSGTATPSSGSSAPIRVTTPVGSSAPRLPSSIFSRARSARSRAGRRCRASSAQNASRCAASSLALAGCPADAEAKL